MSRAARCQVAVRQTSATRLLEQVEDNLALAKRIQKRAECAQVEPIRAHTDEVAGNPTEFPDQHAEHHRFLRNLHADQLFDGQRHAEIHVHPGQVVHAVRVRDPLNRRQVLTDLLGTAVQVAQMRCDLVNDFPVRPEEQAQHAVRAGMLRPHVDEHLVGADVEFNDAGIFECNAHSLVRRSGVA